MQRLSQSSIRPDLVLIYRKPDDDSPELVRPRPEPSMSIAQPDVIDIIGTDQMTGDVILTIGDHLDWPNRTAHQQLLQTKLNWYLAFVESGEIMQCYPGAKGRTVVFRVVFRFAPDDGGRLSMIGAREIVAAAGFTLRDELHTGAPFN